MALSTTLKQSKSVHNAARVFIESNPDHPSMVMFQESYEALGVIIESVESEAKESAAQNLYETGVPTINNESSLEQRLATGVKAVATIFSPISSYINSISVLQVSEVGQQILSNYPVINQAIQQISQQVPSISSMAAALATGGITPAAAAAAAGCQTGLFGLNIPQMILQLIDIQPGIQEAINALMFQLDLTQTNDPIEIDIKDLKRLIEWMTVDPPNLPRIDETRLKVQEPSENPNALYISLAQMLAQMIVQIIVRTVANPENNSEAKGASGSVSGAIG